MTSTDISGKANADAVETAFMDGALQLAAKGVALASPNPMVGAVLVRDGKLIGEGFHTYDGLRHAEIIALQAAGEAARGATLYVNLEPCCHTGRTGPCTQALIAAGVARVVAAMPDPNPRVAGRGFEQLRAAGIAVAVGLREAEARRLNDAFARWIVSRKPLVTLKAALTLDGQLVLPGTLKNAQLHGDRTREDQRWITSPESRSEVQRIRHASDALVTGIGTVLMDNPLLTDRTGLPRRRKLLRVVLDSHLRLPLRSKLVRSAEGDVLVFTRIHDDSPEAQALRRAGVEVVPLVSPGSRLDLREAIVELGRRDILRVLLEAGAILSSAALSARIVDKVRVFFAPKFAVQTHVDRAPARAGRRALVAPLGLTAQIRKLQSGKVQYHVDSSLKLRDVSLAKFGPDFAIEGYLRDVYRTR